LGLVLAISFFLLLILGFPIALAIGISSVLVAGMVYRRNPTFKGALMGLFLGSCTMIVLMVPLNFIFTSMFLDLPKEAVKEIIITAVIPFNVFKTAVNSTLTILLYKNVGRILMHWGA